ncbi:oligopeptide/dipeptide ABC transporter ATP-binding protein [Nonomuraea sp. NPDC050790]|uniref:oligopeptide/dipeptide ABC transporter ATP-binding protein n=1 Tax=Nonomuraea sp. NPDC050790 TaxID=3364371 RepID=UPI00378D67E3
MKIARLRISGPGLIVDGLDLEVSGGQTVGLVGESGSGKSLAARAAAGLLPKGLHATGSVTFDGRELLGARERAWRSVRGTRVSLLMQDPFAMLNPLRTAGAHVAESLRGRRDRREVLRRLAEVGIDDPGVAERHPFQLSGGMRQRVALAAALAADPELLIADEPTTALDAATQHDILMLIKDIQRARGMGVLLITHDLRVAFELCDRVAVMYAGRIVEQGPPAEMGKMPAHPYTAGLLAAVPTVERRLTRLIGIRGNVPAAADVTASCAFAARCDQAGPECGVARPPLRELRPDRLTACLHEVRPRIRTEEEAPAPRRIAAEAVLRVTGLGKRYGTHVALSDVSLRVYRGENLGVVGGSGSGKTTLARSILGLVRPDAGTIELADPARPRHHLVQCVFQDPTTSLNPALTVGATLAEAAAQGPAEGRLTVTELLELVGLPPAYARKKPVGLSGGERQRVAIARALSVRPALLICDEPVASLDVSVQAHVLELLREVGTSMLFITHDLAVVRQMADRLVVLSRGRIVESGETAQVLDTPEHDYTRGLLASVPSTL